MDRLDVPVSAVERNDTFPAAADVVVVGGGIVGVSTALYLAQRGISVILCEKGRIAGEQSGRNWGWVRAAIRDPREIELARASLGLWDDLEREIDTDIGFRRSGSLFACETESELARYSAWLEQARPFGLSSHMLTSREAAAQLSGATRPVLGALYTPDDARAEPDLAAPAIARAAQRKGVVILQNMAVRGLDIVAGRVAGVVTERGRIAATTVVVASGVWSRLFVQPLGLRLPQLKIQGSVLRTAPITGGPDGEGWLKAFAFRKRLDGGYTIADGTENRVSIVPDHFRFLREFLPALKSEWSMLTLRLEGRFLEELTQWRPRSLDQASLFEKIRCLAPSPVASTNRRALLAAAEMFPVFRNAKVTGQWAGMIDVTPDAIPVISPIDEIPGLILSTGYSGHGFGVGPGAGRLTADLVTGDTPIVDPRAFRFSRFTDGSATMPGKLA